MELRKSPADLVARFEKALPNDTDCERRKMFGFPAAFVNGNMFASLHQDQMILRLDAKTRAAFQGVGGQAFEPQPGRVMREYLAVPPSVLSNPLVLRRWVGKAFAYALSLPAKTKPKADDGAPKPPAAPLPPMRRGRGRLR